MGADTRRSISVYFVLESQQAHLLPAFFRSPIDPAIQTLVFCRSKSGKMDNLSCSENLYAWSENARWFPSYHAGATHAIISTVPFQRHGNHESGDAYVNSAFNYAQPTQFLHHSSQGPQFPPLHPMPNLYLQAKHLSCQHWIRCLSFDFLPLQRLPNLSLHVQRRLRSVPRNHLCLSTLNNSIGS